MKDSQDNSIRSRLASRGLTPNKRFGQNFLTDGGILDRIIEAAELTPADTVLEIGPGTGVLTRRIADQAGRLIAVEIDRGLAALLQEEFAGEPRVTVINGDILKTDLRQILSDAPDGSVKVIANLPYYITTPILLALLPQTDRFSRFVVMMQKEVADRMQASPGSKDYGALSLIVQYYALPRIVTLVPPSAFYPLPEVTSAVLRLDRPEAPPVNVRDPERMFALIRAAFGKRRKTLVNAVSGAPQLSVDAGRMKRALADHGFSERVRGEELTLRDYAVLTDALDGESVT